MTTCFVIGPIGQMHATPGSPERESYESALDLYENVIAAACTQLGIEAVRADQISISGDITDQIFRRLYESDLVIADVTGANANVMYELGLRHSLDKLTIQVADVSTALPFDVNSIRTILIKRTPHGLVAGRTALFKAIEAGLRDGPDRVAATRIWEAASRGAIDEITQLLNSPSKETAGEDEDGYVDIMLSLDGAFTALTATTQAISESMTEMSATSTEFGAKMTKLNVDNAPIPARLAIIDDLASELLKHGETFHSHTTSFKDEISALDKKMKPLLRFIADNDTLRASADAHTFMSKVEEMAGAARGSLDGLAGFGGAVSQLGGLSKSLRKPTSLIATGVAQMTDGVAMLEEWDFSVKQINAHREE